MWFEISNKRCPYTLHIHMVGFSKPYIPLQPTQRNTASPTLEKVILGVSAAGLESHQIVCSLADYQTLLVATGVFPRSGHHGGLAAPDTCDPTAPQVKAFIFVCTYIHIYIYIYTHMYYICIHIYIYTHIERDVYIYIYREREIDR